MLQELLPTSELNKKKASAAGSAIFPWIVGDE